MWVVTLAIMLLRLLFPRLCLPVPPPAAGAVAGESWQAPIYARSNDTFAHIQCRYSRDEARYDGNPQTSLLEAQATVAPRR